jgi:hypothetical protein
LGQGQLFEIVMTTNNNSGSGVDKRKLEQVVELLRFALSLDDEEVVRTTIESVCEILQEEIDK